MFATSSSIEKILPAFVLAQSEMTAAIKAKINPAFRSKYADLSSVWEAFIPAFGKHGLAIMQAASVDDRRVRLETRVAHASGEWFSGTVEAVAKDDSPQAIGSCITYLRRYGASTLVGVVSDDDDGQSASQPPPRRQVPLAARPTSAPDIGDSDLAREVTTKINEQTTSSDKAEARALYEQLKASDAKRAEDIRAGAKGDYAAMKAALQEALKGVA